MKTKITITTCLIISMVTGVYAQSIGPSTINASGGSKVISGNTYEFSIGEMALVNTASGSNIIVTNGVLQPVASTTRVKDVNYLSDNLKVYPNPSDNVLNIQPDFETGGQLTYHLYDALGRVMLTGEFNLASGKEKQTISLSQLAASSYVLHLNLNKKGITYNASFNVQKIN
ncbi:T9SS type A sorting domain-containing protein [Taibaiella lutea]|uniref:T9SS type A sorting domain-containing protein n=1 Tax=Taibaiella lutea TaxID=2608001 RepID=A0A5M6CFI3_9BACT|nr:T9SS type A sorting domain-containing protein [Taibaiella lutea]KAA5533200.1 T9SS type A sorting domain-containing protein [Taibaiella lutea]